MVEEMVEVAKEREGGYVSHVWQRITLISLFLRKFPYKDGVKKERFIVDLYVF